MKVLITGGMGVVGAEASRRFVREGHRPIIFARHRDEWLIRDILEEVDIELGDVLDMPRLLDVIKRHRVTHIVHAAAFVGAVSAANPALSVQVNVMGMVNVLEAARAFDVTRVVYTSAKGVYGPVLGEYGAPTYKPVPEDFPKNPKRIYDSAKLMAEQPLARIPDNLRLRFPLPERRNPPRYGHNVSARQCSLVGVTITAMLAVG
jgi:UDP-glucose 4-epimerase